MNDFDDLDDVFGPLRSAATPAELSGESAIVDTMARNHRHTKGSTMFTSRRARVAAFVAAGVLGFGGVAAAGNPGGSIDFSHLVDPATGEEIEVTPTTSEDEEDDDTGDTTTTSTTEAVNEEEDLQVTQVILEETSEEGEVVADDVWDPQDDLSTEFFNEEHCLEGNHGKTVSAAARGDEEYEETLGQYTQSEVARSSCGKDYDVEEIDEVDEREDTDEKEVDDDKDDDEDGEKKKTERADKPGRPDHAGSRSNGKKGRG